jgi:hypothetical protein
MCILSWLEVKKLPGHPGVARLSTELKITSLSAWKLHLKNKSTLKRFNWLKVLVEFYMANKRSLFEENRDIDDSYYLYLLVKS